MSFGRWDSGDVVWSAQPDVRLSVELWGFGGDEDGLVVVSGLCCSDGGGGGGEVDCRCTGKQVGGAVRASTGG